MMKPLVELLVVEHTFWFEGNGVRMLILHPLFALPRGWSTRGWSNRTEKVVVIRPDGSELNATAQIAMSHLNIRDPDLAPEERWRISLWLTDRNSNEVPVGSRLLVRAEIRAAIIPPNDGVNSAS